MTSHPASYPRHRFPAEIISHAVWLYHVFSLSLRDVELILAASGTGAGNLVRNSPNGSEAAAQARRHLAP